MTLKDLRLSEVTRDEDEVNDLLQALLRDDLSKLNVLAINGQPNWFANDNVENMNLFLARQTQLKRLHFERSELSPDILSSLLDAVKNSGAAERSFEELYLQGG